ncbi:MAG: signal recognition particle protein [Crenarchaeota archaeon]|nr:signal recognition particle protein [Thermoproteota archaeon]
MKNLIESFSKIVSRIRGLVYIDDETLREILKEIQRALLKADVSVEVVYNLTKNIEKKFKESKIPQGVSPKDYLLYVIYNEMVNILGGDSPPSVDIPKRPYKLMLVGIEGCGKTTSAAKLAYYYMKKKLKVGLVQTDVHRPGAKEQLKQLADRIGALFYGDPGHHDPIRIAEEGVEKMLKEGVDLVIIDTAGRHKSEQELMEEVKKLYETIKPDEVMLVIDATSGKQAAVQAEAFMKYVPINSIFITKMDSTARGGGALMSVIKTGARIKFIGTGEDVEEIEVFNPRRFVSRLLGLGDLETLIEKVKALEEEEKILKEVEKDIEEGKVTLLTLKKQLETIMKLGPLSKILELLPVQSMPMPVLKGLSDDQLKATQERIRKWYAILQSMTREELLNPDILDASRIRRIARGSGTTPRDVRELLQYYQMIKRLINEMKKSRKRLPKSLLKQMDINLGELERAGR